MGRKPRVDRSPEEKWQIVQEGIKSGNVSETCRLALHYRRYIDGRTRRRRERRQRLGGKALRRAKPRRTSASGSWNGRWDVSLWRLKS